MISLSILSSLFIVVFAIGTFQMLKIYSRPDTHKLVLLIVFTTWLLTFSYIWLISIDLLMISKDFFYPTWSATYWTSFVLMWFILPILQDYLESGEFSFWGRMKESLLINLKFYSVAIILLVIFCIYLLASSSVRPNDLWGYLVCFSNIWGLTLATLLLGYGLVEIPRHLWRKSQRQLQMRYHYWKVSKVKQNFDFSKDDMVELIALAQTISDRCRNTINQRFCDAICESIPSIEELNLLGVKEAALKHAHQSTDLADYPDRLKEMKNIPASDLRRKDLSSLHYHLKRTVSVVRTHSMLYRSTVENAISLEDAIKDEEGPPHPWRAGIREALRWRWKVYYRSWWFRVCALVCGVLSLFTLWSEITIMVPKVQLSPFGVFIDLSRPLEAPILVLGFVGYGYMSICAFYSAFRLRLGTYYHMHTDRATEQSSLLLNASYILRLAPPLAYNFLTFTRQKDTSFGKIVTRMDVVPFFGSDLNYWLPLLILLFCVATTFNVYSKLLKKLHVERFNFENDDAEGNQEELSQSEIQEGRRLLNKARVGGVNGLARQDFELVAKAKREEDPTALTSSLSSLNSPRPMGSERKDFSKTPFLFAVDDHPYVKL